MESVSFKGIQFQSGMPRVVGAGKGSSIGMVTTDARHIVPGGAAGAQKSENIAGSFAEALNNAVSGVEKLDANANRLTMQAIMDPDSVEVHQLMIAAEKARFALTLTKNLADGAIRAYKELTNPR